jgi:SatD family (SatD)
MYYELIKHMGNSYILMADIVSSRKREPEILMTEFRAAVRSANRELADGILSPFTITLGDEFQGVVKTLLDATKTILWLEELRYKGILNSELRYVVNYGDIATPINSVIAYGMNGDGFTEARKLLNDKRRGKSRYCFRLGNEHLGIQMQRLFDVLSALTRAWEPADSSLIFDMIDTMNNEEVGDKHGKNRSQIWKRRNTLFINEYVSLKQVIIELSEAR